MIKINNLSFKYPSTQNNVINEINFEIQTGEIITILGANGSGKSTLLKLLRGSLKPSAGTITLNKMASHLIARKDIARQIAVVPQSLPRTFAFPVKEVVAMGRFAHQGFFGRTSNKDIEAVNWALNETDTAFLANRSIMQISGGELQRVLVARALAQQTPILLLDEASSHLDLHHRLDMLHLLKRLNKQHNTTIIQVSHDFDLSAEISDRILILDNHGDITYLGKPSDAITTENIKKAFGVNVDIQKNPQTNAPRVYPKIDFK